MNKEDLLREFIEYYEPLDTQYPIGKQYDGFSVTEIAYKGETFLVYSTELTDDIDGAVDYISKIEPDADLDKLREELIKNDGWTLCRTVIILPYMEGGTQFYKYNEGCMSVDVSDNFIYNAMQEHPDWTYEEIRDSFFSSFSLELWLNGILEAAKADDE